MNYKVKYILVIFFTASAVSFSQLNKQPERYTKGVENGYAWIAMNTNYQDLNDSKMNYLSDILQRYRLLKQKFPEAVNLGCNDEVNSLLSQDKSNEILLEDVADKIDKFYLDEDNMVIPVMFAYCYVIKEFAGFSKEGLNNYRNAVLDFCND